MLQMIPPAVCVKRVLTCTCNMYDEVVTQETEKFYSQAKSDWTRLAIVAFSFSDVF